MTEPSDVKKTSELSDDDLLSDDLVLDSDELFDLDIPLDDPLPGHDPNQQDSATKADHPEEEEGTAPPDPDSASFDDLSDLSMEDLPSDALDSDALASDSALLQTSTTDSTDDLETLFSRLDEPATDSISEGEHGMDLTDKISDSASIETTPDVEHKRSSPADSTTTEPQPHSDDDVPKAVQPPVQSYASNVSAEPERKTDKNTNSATSRKNGTKEPGEPESVIDGANKMKLANTMIYILGAVLALVGGGATWLASSAIERAGELERSTAPLAQENRDSGQAREQRLTALETQTQAYEQRIVELEEQVHTLTTVLSSTASKKWQETLAQPDMVETPPAPAGNIATATKNMPATPTPPVSQPTVRKTDAKTAPPAAVDTGKWAVNMTSYESQKEAEQEVGNFRNRGIKANYIRILIKGKPWYRLRVTGFSTEHDAVAYEKYLKDFQDIDAWHDEM